MARSTWHGPHGTVRVQALPKPTYDSDFTVVVDRTRLPELYEAAEADGFPAPDQCRGGWVDTVADMPLVTFRLSLEGLGIDVDISRAEPTISTNSCGAGCSTR